MRREDPRENKVGDVEDRYGDRGRAVLEKREDRSKDVSKIIDQRLSKAIANPNLKAVDKGARKQKRKDLIHQDDKINGGEVVTYFR